jgi:hypothetical protein
MSGEFLNEDGKPEGDKTEGKSLRAFAEATAAENAKLKADLAALQAQVKEQSLKSIWDGLDVVVPDKVKAFFTGEPTAEAVKAWVEENQDAFRFEPKPGSDTPTDEDAELAKLQAQLDTAQNLGKDKVDLGLAGKVAAIRNAALPKNEAELKSQLETYFKQ